MTEAPVSFNCRMISPAGYDCTLTLRAEDSAELMPRVLKALEWLSNQGFRPTAWPSSPAPTGATEANGANGTPPICPTHGKAMKPSQFGGWYCPVKIADDDGTGRAVYCKQKVSY